MKNRINKKRKMAVAAFFMSGCLMLLAGCSNTVEYPTEISEVTQEGKPDGLMGDVAENWEEKIQTTGQSDNNTYRININADVVVPQTGSMSVIEVSEPEFDAAYEEQMIDTIFGDTKIYDNDDIEAAQNSALLHTQLEKILKCDSYLGERDGVNYTITLLEGWNNHNARVKSIILEPKDLWDICPEELQNDKELWGTLCGTFWDIYPREEDPGKNNQCSLTVDEARNLAGRFLEQFDSLEMIEVSCNAMCWYGEHVPVVGGMEGEFYSETVRDGYIFNYQMGMDGMIFQNFLTDVEALSGEWYDEGGGAYSMNLGATVVVMDEGVIRMELRNPLILESIVEHVECLGIESIQNIIKNEIKEDVEQFELNIPSSSSGYRPFFNLFELGYMRVQDNEAEQHYSFIPVWRLVRKGDEFQGGIYINAIDGTMIGLSIGISLFGMMVMMFMSKDTFL